MLWPLGLVHPRQGVERWTQEPRGATDLGRFRYLDVFGVWQGFVLHVGVGGFGLQDWG